MLEVAQMGLYCRDSHRFVVVTAVHSVERSFAAEQRSPFAGGLPAAVGIGVPFGSSTFAAEVLKPWVAGFVRLSRRSLSSLEPGLEPLLSLELAVAQASAQGMVCLLHLCSKKALRTHLQARKCHLLCSSCPSSHLAVPDIAAC